MALHSSHGLANNAWAQMGLVALVAIVLVTIAARYVW